MNRKMRARLMMQTQLQSSKFAVAPLPVRLLIAQRISLLFSREIMQCGQAASAFNHNNLIPRVISRTFNNECWRMSDWILINTKADLDANAKPLRASTDLIHFRNLLSNIILADCLWMLEATERSYNEQHHRPTPLASSKRTCAHFQKNNKFSI